MTFKGVIPAVCTWFKDDGGLDFNTQFDHADFLIDAGVNGLFFQGSGGEFPYLTFSERKEHATAMVKHVNRRVPVLLGVSSNNLDEVIALAKHAEKAGADGIVAITPYFWKVSDDSVLEFYKAVGQACSLPLVAYNFPALTGQGIGSRLLLRMVESVPKLVAIKDTIDSLSHIRNIVFRVKAVHEYFSVLAGIDEYLFGTLAVGGDGLIGSLINVMPHLSVDLYQAFLNKDFDGIINCQRKISMLSEISMVSVPPIAALKEAILIMGHPGTSCVRPPLGKVSPEGIERIKKIIEKVQE